MKRLMRKELDCVPFITKKNAQECVRAISDDIARKTGGKHLLDCTTAAWYTGRSPDSISTQPFWRGRRVLSITLARAIVKNECPDAELAKTEYEDALEDILRFSNGHRLLGVKETADYLGTSEYWVRKELKVTGITGITAVHIARHFTEEK